MGENSTNNDVIPTRDEPTEPSRSSGEHDMLMSFLDYFRAVLVRKCGGLTAPQLQTTVAESTLTLARLLRHMAFVEDHWFQFSLLGNELPEPWLVADWDAQPDWEMDTAADFSPIELAQQFDAAVARSRAAVEGLGLDHIAAREGRLGATNLRWILIHMIEEYARHCGHADLLREAIDGAVGD
jgi:uncharacterized damage-inducible protein DinB